MYHVSSPENNNASGFTEYNTVDFMIDVPNRKLLKNTIRLEATLSVKSSGSTDLVGTDQIRLDHQIGGHAFIESCVVSLPKSKGVIQNASEYPRYVNSLATGSYVKNDYFSSDLQAELRGCCENSGKVAIQPTASHNTTGDQDPTPANFSIKPLICLNNSTGGDFSFSDNGGIRLSFNLAKVHHALYGADMKSDTSYTLTDVTLRYQTVPEDGQKDKIIMASYAMIKNGVASNSTNVSVRVPSNAVGGCSINFLEQSRESDLTSNAYALMPYPEFSEVSYNFSDSTNQFISYTVTDLGDALHKGMESLKRQAPTSITAQAYSANKGFVLGLDFNGEYIDLSANKFAMNLKSDSTTLGSTPFLVYLYFHTLIVV
jgi:hypothetical protein|tara:strand:+ start:133 stop:1251 length:1119 start_codon:yes stop_codon:yes gene_type:complete